MLEAITWLGALIAIALLVVKPTWGIPALFIVRPLVDTQWEHPLVLGLKLTEIVSVLVPMIVLSRAALSGDQRSSLRSLPMRGMWLWWTVDVASFSAMIAYSSGAMDGLNVFFRHVNGLAGFYMVQAYMSEDDADTRRFVWSLVLAGLFPVGTGMVEAITGHHWNTTYGEDGVVRGIGLYHDAITIRYYALQTIMGLLLLCSLYVARRRLLQAAAMVYGLAALVVIQQAYSKAGATIVAAWALLWPTLRRTYRQLAALCAAALVVGAWYGTQVMSAVGFIFKREIGALEGTSTVNHAFAGRWYLWQDMLGEWQSFGILAKTFGAGHVATGAHNDYIQILFHGGLVALSVYGLLLSLTLVRIVKNLRAERGVFQSAALLAFVMWLVDTIGLVPSAYSGYQWFVWGVIGLSFRKVADTAGSSAVEAAPGKQATARIYVPGAAEPGGLML